ncbi:hypothetical protein CHCC15322_2794 [Bacillus licheniformis]|nr:hypothetical protein CHCC20373_3012 [Bacillus licheniformis]TWL59544.1 hypothetical protein CHCC15322_2794 [Bacillus licheniformis]TWM57836.1 hypothetical protein CHCC14813_3685 [Bacillus licheniformis]
MSAGPIGAGVMVFFCRISYNLMMDMISAFFLAVRHKKGYISAQFSHIG